MSVQLVPPFVVSKIWPRLSPLKPEKPEKAANAVFGAAGLATTCVTTRPGVLAWSISVKVGVTDVTLFETQIAPTSVPTYTVLELLGATATLVITHPPPAQLGFEVEPVKSGEMTLQEMPPSVVCHTRNVPKYRFCGLLGSSTSGGMKFWLSVSMAEFSRPIQF